MPTDMPTEIDRQITTYSAWIEERIGADLRPQARTTRVEHHRESVDLDLDLTRRTPPRGRRTGMRVAVDAVLAAAALVGVLVVAGRSSDSPTSPPATAPFLDGSNTTPATTAPGQLTPPSVVTSAPPAPVATTVFVASTTTVPRPVIDTLAIGESVMQGAQNELPKYGVNVDARESIQGEGVVDLVRTTRQQYDITSAVVIQSGTNGPVTEAQYDEMADLVADLPHAYFITINAPLAWVRANNALIEALPASHPNVTVIDWAALSQQLSADDLSESDGGVHLNSQHAVRFYSNMILAALGKPLIPDG